jgi:hypothetical protein
MHDIERIFHEHNKQLIAAFSTQLKYQIASRLLKIQAHSLAAAQMKGSSRQYFSLIVGLTDYSRAGGNNGDGYRYNDDEFRGNELVEGTQGYSTNASGKFCSLLFSYQLRLSITDITLCTGIKDGLHPWEASSQHEL